MRYAILILCSCISLLSICSAAKNKDNKSSLIKGIGKYNIGRIDTSIESKLTVNIPNIGDMQVAQIGFSTLSTSLNLYHNTSYKISLTDPMNSYEYFIFCSLLGEEPPPNSSDKNKLIFSIDFLEFDYKQIDDTYPTASVVYDEIYQALSSSYSSKIFRLNNVKDITLKNIPKNIAEDGSLQRTTLLDSQGNVALLIYLEKPKITSLMFATKHFYSSDLMYNTCWRWYAPSSGIQGMPNTVGIKLSDIVGIELK